MWANVVWAVAGLVYVSQFFMGFDRAKVSQHLMAFG